MKIEVGNRVKILSEDFEGTIKTVISDTRVVITCTDGFDYEKSINEFVVVGEGNAHIYNVSDEDVLDKIKSSNISNWNTKKNLLSKYKSATSFSLENRLEIDLHLEELVEFPQKLDDWQKLHTQMQHVKKCLNAAFNENIRSIVFIHGVGTGVLKTELINFLSNYDGIIIKDADFREYGRGATEVLIKNS